MCFSIYRRIASVLGLLTAFGLQPCSAQQIILKTGQAVAAQNLKFDGTQLVGDIEVAGQVGKVGYPLATIDRLEMAKPPQMVQAEGLLATGKFAQAAAAIEPVIASQQALRGIKGNYWAQASLVKTSAQIGEGKGQDAAALLTQLSLYTLDPSVVATAKARLAGILAQGGKEKAGEAIRLADEIIASSENRSVLAEAYLARGRACFAQDNFSDALMAYLHLPVFYDGQPTSTAAAVLGSGRCYMALGDTRRGVRTFLEIEDQFPNMPEAAAAKAEMEKGGKRLQSVATELKNEKADADKQFRGEEVKKDARKEDDSDADSSASQ